MLNRKFGGGGEIRTLGGLSPSLVFKTSAFNHSATPPRQGQNLTISAVTVKGLLSFSLFYHSLPVVIEQKRGWEKRRKSLILGPVPVSSKIDEMRPLERA